LTRLPWRATRMTRHASIAAASAFRRAPRLDELISSGLLHALVLTRLASLLLHTSPNLEAEYPLGGFGEGREFATFGHTVRGPPQGNRTERPPRRERHERANTGASCWRPP